MYPCDILGMFDRALHKTSPVAGRALFRNFLGGSQGRIPLDSSTFRSLEIRVSLCPVDPWQIYKKFRRSTAQVFLGG